MGTSTRICLIAEEERHCKEKIKLEDQDRADAMIERKNGDRVII
jgi:hypothetical protein